MAKQSFVQIYTGNGKGKTTAAIGLTIRALGAGHRVLFLQFMKTAQSSEQVIFKQLGSNLVVKTWGKPCFIAKQEDLTAEFLHQWAQTCVVFTKGNPPADYVALINEGVAFAHQALISGDYDLVVLDELNMAIYFELIPIATVLAMLSQRHPHTEVVITGRHCPEALLDYADLVTEMKEIKHYYEQGVEARLGIEH